MVYLHYKLCLRYAILAGNPRIIIMLEIHHSGQEPSILPVRLKEVQYLTKSFCMFSVVCKGSWDSTWVRDMVQQKKDVGITTVFCCVCVCVCAYLLFWLGNKEGISKEKGDGRSGGRGGGADYKGSKIALYTFVQYLKGRHDCINHNCDLQLSFHCFLQCRWQWGADGAWPVVFSLIVLSCFCFSPHNRCSHGLHFVLFPLLVGLFQ